MSKTIINENPAKKQLIIRREFNAPIELVWKAWTESELLDQWWAPKPWYAKTKYMDFRPGGYWLYCMNGPEGEQHWARADYLKIITQESFEGDDAFCDEEGNINHDIPGIHWQVKFIPMASNTLVEVITTFASVEDLKTIVEMGFKEGFTAAHGNLDELLSSMTVN